MSAPVIDTARQALELGIVPLPVAQDGTKRPALREWTTWQAERPDVATVERWFARTSGIGVVCGAVSGGLELLEFEGRAVADGLLDAFNDLATDAGLADLVNAVDAGYCERTPSGGLHFLYRIADGPVPGNTKLAERPDPTKPNGRLPLIETRGEGGFCVVAPSNGRTHPTGGAWELVNGGLDTVATITVAERNELARIARLLDEMPPPAAPRERLAPRQVDRLGDDDRPGDEINATVDPTALLVQHGWTHVGSRGGADYLRRPGKDRGISATVAGPGEAKRTGQHRTVKVFTSSTVLPTEGTLDAYALKAWLEHGGDLSACARAWRADHPRSAPVLRERTPPSDAGEVEPSNVPANLPPSLWTARPWLAHVRQAAHARSRSADAVLVAVLARIAAMTPHSLAIEPLVGGPGSLNFYALVIGPSGAGKSQAVSVAQELVPASAAVAHGVSDLVDDRPLGSGEGLAELYMGEVLEENESGKKVKVRRQVARNAWVYVDEGESLVAQLDRKGATIMDALRRGWTGATLGQSNASADRTRVVPQGGYRLALVAGFQPEKVARLLDDAQGGTPQRFLWASATDPAVPDEPPAWPGALDWARPYAADLAVAATSSAGYTRHIISVAPAVAAEVRAANLARVRGHAAGAGLDAHADLHKLKLAALFALVDGRLAIDDSDWALARTVWATSVRVRTWCIDQVTADATRTEVARTEAHARRELAAEAARQSAPDRVTGVAARLARWVHTQGEPVARKALRERLSGGTGGERPLLEPALAHAVAAGWLVEVDGRWARGQSQPSA